LVLYLAAFAALADWGAGLGHGPLAPAAAVLAPALAILVWGRFAAPGSAHRLPAAGRVPLELVALRAGQCS
jgi:hypothetical protein